MEPVSQAVRTVAAAAPFAVAGCEPTYRTVELIKPTGVPDREIAARIVDLVEADSTTEIQVIDLPEVTACCRCEFPDFLELTNYTIATISETQTRA